MKNHKKGFTMPVMIVIVIVITATVIYYLGKQNDTQPLVSNSTANTDELIRSLIKTQDINVFPAIRDELAAVADSETVAAIARAFHEDAKEWWQQSNLMGALIRIRSESAVSGLNDIVKNDTDSALRSQASIALAMIGSPSAIQALVTAIEQSTSSNYKTRWAESLSAVSNEGSLDYLIDLLNKNKDEVVRYSVALALGNINKAKSLSSLISAQKVEQSTSVKGAITASIAKLSAR